MSPLQTSSTIKVLVCHAEPLLQIGLAVSLAEEPGIEVISVLHERLTTPIDVVVTDTVTALAMYEQMNQCRRNACLSASRILVVAIFAREYAIRRVLEQGVQGYILLGSPVKDLIDGVRALGKGVRYLCPEVAQSLAQCDPRGELTSREDDVLRLLAYGHCNKSIARLLGIADGTVKAHVKSILAKLNARCRTEAANIAAERGLVDFPGISRSVIQHSRRAPIRLGVEAMQIA